MYVRHCGVGIANERKRWHSAASCVGGMDELLQAPTYIFCIYIFVDARTNPSVSTTITPDVPVRRYPIFDCTMSVG